MMNISSLKDSLNKVSGAAAQAAKSVAEVVENASDDMRDAVSGAVQNIKETVEKKDIERKQKNERENQEKADKKKREEEIAAGYYVEDGKLVVSTVAGMQTWLSNLGKDTTPALMQTLQMQLQVLQSVQSPTMTGMAVDNMILCLKKALDLSTDKKEADNIREAFSSMLQNYMFFQEANVRYASIKNKDEASDLLKQAGNMLSQAVVKTAEAVSQGNLDTGTLEVRNIFDSDEIRKGYIAKLFSWYADKKEIKEKEEIFYKTVESLFDTYNQYADLFGPSVLSKGMLGRYRKALVDYRKQVVTEQYVKRNSKINPDNIATISNGIAGIVTGSVIPGLGIASGIAQSLSGLAGLATEMMNNSSKGLDIEAYCLLSESLSREIASMKEQLSVLEGERDGLIGKLSEAGLLQFSLKKEIQSQLEEKKTEIAVIKNAIQPLQEKLTEMKLAFPDAKAIFDDIVAYDARLKAIEEKFG